VPVVEGRTRRRFRVDIKIDAGVALMSLFGALDLRAVRPFLRELVGVEPRVRHVVVDARGLTFLDAAGLQVLLHAAQRARFETWDLTVVRGGATERLFSFPAVSDRLDLVDSTAGLFPPLPPAA
jgi:anti-anti-sigma factor